jgi:GxxExxY protein
MITTNKKLIYADLSYSIRGAIFTVYNNLGFGHKEQVYQKALAQEFNERNIPFEREVNLEVKYKNIHVGNYRPDFIVDQKIILELKAVEFIPKTYEQQLLHYLKSTNYQLGLLINFGASKLYIKRLVWTLDPRKSVTNQRKSL